jgi:hypothetical protein
VENPVIAEGVGRDPGDDYLVALAHAADVDHLVSGDTDLTNLASVSPPCCHQRSSWTFSDRYRAPAGLLHASAGTSGQPVPW